MITRGNSGSVTIGTDTECEIASWTATIQSESETVTTMCSANNPQTIESSRFVEFSVESYIWFGDVVTADVVLTNEVLSVSGSATMESIEIATPSDGLVTFSYNGRITDYVITP